MANSAADLLLLSILIVACVPLDFSAVVFVLATLDFQLQEPRPATGHVACTTGLCVSQNQNQNGNHLAY